MNTIASQITSLMIVYATVYSDGDQSKHQSSASLAFVRGIHRDRWILRTKGQLRGKCFHLMTSSCNFIIDSCPHTFGHMRQWIVSALVQIIQNYSAPNHHLNQCWVVVGGVENVPVIIIACATRKFTCLVRGPWIGENGWQASISYYAIHVSDPSELQQASMN